MVGEAVRLFLAGVLSTMILGAAYMFYTTARYTVLQAYKPVVVEIPVLIKGKSPPIERAATSSHATTSLERSSDQI
jgi:hypothetical protein